MISLFDSSDAEVPFPLSLTPPSRYLTSPIPPLFGMAPDKAMTGTNISSPSPSQRSLHDFMTPTPRKLFPVTEIANSNTPSPRSTRTQNSAARHTPRPPHLAQLPSLTVNLTLPPQGGQPEPQTSSERMRSPSFELLAQLEPETDEDDDHGDHFKELLTEARKEYTHSDPEFLIRYPGVETRIVELENDELGELVFEHWDERRRKGFWTLDMGDQHKYIVKHLAKGYHAWLGPNAEFGETPVAWPKGRSQKKTPKKSPTIESRGTASSAMANDDRGASDDNAMPARAFRQRSRSQMMPYTAEKLNHKRALQGKPKQKEDPSYDELQTPGPTIRQISPEYVSVKKRRVSSKSDTSTLTPLRTRPEATWETINRQTRLNTRTTAAWAGLCEVIYMEDALTIDALFAEVTQAWHSKITENSEVKLAVKFPWLNESDTSSILSVRQDRPRSFDRMLEVINKAPCWKDGSNTECVVDIYVMIE